MTNDEFRALRRQLGITQAELAGELGYHRRQIIAFEAGQFPIPKVVELALEAIERQAEDDLIERNDLRYPKYDRARV